jgi:CheY-like chemotaxis protein
LLPLVVRKEDVDAVTPSKKRPRVLVIDDEPAIGALIARVLESSADVICAHSGPMALEILQVDTDFAVIFCDLLMPGMGGERLYERVRELELAVESRFVFLTGGLDLPGTFEFLSSIPNVYIEKPFSLKRILDEVALHTR